MFSSVRARLTLWYTGVLALVLITFALAGYFFLSYTLNRRTDDALGEMADAFAATLADDEREGHASGEDNTARGEDRSISPDAAVMEAVSQNQFRDYQFVVFDNARRVVASSAVQKKGSGPGRMRPPVAPQIAEVLDAVVRLHEAALYFATLSDGDNQYRVVGRRVRVDQESTHEGIVRKERQFSLGKPLGNARRTA